MPLILGTNSIKDTGYDVDNSVRLDGSSSYMTKTMGTPTNIDKYSFSFWVKRSKLGVQQSIFRSTNGGATNDSHVTFQADDTLRFEEYGGSSSIGKLQTTQVFRDTSAWYSILLVYDSGNGTAGNRMRMYVNGTEVTTFGTDNNPSQNADSYFNRSGETLSFGRTPYSGGGNYFSGYVAELVMCDGQALTPTDIGEFDEDSGIFKPINVSGLTFGTNGFYLDFEDSSALGNDAAGSNNFTVNNLTAVDQATDTCTNNFATMNPLDNFYGNYTFSEGNCQVVSSSGDKAYVTSTLAVSKGKWYFETNISAMVTDERFLIGIAPRGAVEDDHPDSTANGGINFSGFNAVINSQGSAILNNFYGNNTTRFDGWTGIIGMALDLTDGSEQITFSKDGAWVTGSGTTSTNFANALQVDISAKLNESTASGFWHLVVGEGNSSAAGTFQINFGNPPFSISSGNTDGNGYGNFEYAVPSGYYSLNTKNLAEYG